MVLNKKLTVFTVRGNLNMPNNIHYDGTTDTNLVDINLTDTIDGFGSDDTDAGTNQSLLDTDLSVQECLDLAPENVNLQEQIKPKPTKQFLIITIEEEILNPNDALSNEENISNPNDGLHNEKVLTNFKNSLVRKSIPLNSNPSKESVPQNHKNALKQLHQNSHTLSISDLLSKAESQQTDFSQFGEIQIWMQRSAPTSESDQTPLMDENLHSEVESNASNIAQQQAIPSVNPQQQAVPNVAPQHTFTMTLTDLQWAIDEALRRDTMRRYRSGSSIGASSRESRDSRSSLGQAHALLSQQQAQQQHEVELARISLEKAQYEDAAQEKRLRIQENEMHARLAEQQKQHEFEENKRKAEESEEKRREEVAEGKRKAEEAKEKQKIVTRDQEREVMDVVHQNIDIYHKKSRNLKDSLDNLFIQTSLKIEVRQKTFVEKLAPLSGLAASLVGTLLPGNGLTKCISGSGIGGIVVACISGISNAFDSHRLMDRGDRVFNEFAERLNTVVLAMTPWISEYPVTRARLDQAGASTSTGTVENRINYRLNELSQDPFSHLRVSGGVDMGIPLTISRNESFGLHHDPIVQSNLVIATQLAREFIYQQNGDDRSELARLIKENAKDRKTKKVNPSVLRVRAMNNLLAGSIAEPGNNSTFLTQEELRLFKRLYNTFINKY